MSGTYLPSAPELMVLPGGSASVARTERERVLADALLRLLRASGSEVTGRDLYADLGLDPSALASTPRPLLEGVHVRSRFPAGSGLTDLEMVDANSPVGGAGRGRLRPAAGRGRVSGRLNEIARTVRWFLFDREAPGAAQVVRVSVAGTLASAALLHLAATGPWVSAIGRIAIGGLR